MSNTQNYDLEWLYEVVFQIIRSPEFRNPIKDFIDDNCGSFIGVDENTLEQGQLHKEFTQLIDNLLETLTKEFGLTEEMFCLAAKKGLQDQKAKKYFEQLISFTNYNFFKNLMTKRNFQLEELAYKQMMEDKNGDNNNNEEGEMDNEELERKRKEMEDNELQCALKMSLAVEEEKKKLEAIEDEELQRAIQLSLSEQQAKEEQSPIAQMQPTPSKMHPVEQKKEPKKQEPKKMEEPQNVVETKLNPIAGAQLNPVDKVALKQKMLLEHDQKMKNIASQKLAPLPIFSANNEGLNKKLNEFEQNKAKKLQEYREMILKMKKEKRQKEESEVDDILKVGGEQKMSEEEQKKLNMRKQLADKLKAKLNIKK